jgi:hypothetical protein
MVIIALLSCPLNSANELGRKFSQLPSSPDFIHIKGNYCYTEKGVGIQNVIIWDVERQRMADAIEFLNNRWVRAYTSVPGLSFSIFPALELGEAVRMIDLPPRE